MIDTIENGNDALYQIKWRIFGDFGLQFLNKTLKIKIGHLILIILFFF
jgi:hypothetical protein